MLPLLTVLGTVAPFVIELPPRITEVVPLRLSLQRVYVPVLATQETPS